jgi:hypothetical protein
MKACLIGGFKVEPLQELLEAVDIPVILFRWW